MTFCSPAHGGADALGVPAHDLSSNVNACGPCPLAARALAAVDARAYPDPAYTRLRALLGAWHGVAASRIVMAASASEFIQRLTAAVALQGDGHAPRRAVWLPRHAYGDYARAARACGLPLAAAPDQAALLWACEPSSPLGQSQADLPALVAHLTPAQTLVLDEAYAPLRLQGACSLDTDALQDVWRLITPNKALGLTGVRAAYAIAPRHAPADGLARVQALAPSWPVGAHGVALLQAWASDDVAAWLDDCRAQLADWRARQADLLTQAGWRVLPGQAAFFTARPPLPLAQLPALLHALRQQGFKLRDCASFGLPGHARLAVAAPPVQDALMRALPQAMKLVAESV